MGIRGRASPGIRLWYLRLLAGLCGIALFPWVPVAVAGDADDSANQLLIEAAQLTRDAEKAGWPLRVVLTGRALEQLDQIVERYPGSDVAVKLATGQRIGTVDRSRLQHRFDQDVAKLSKCRSCLFDLSVVLANSGSEQYYTNAFFGRLFYLIAASGDFKRAQDIRHMVEGDGNFWTSEAPIGALIQGDIERAKNIASVLTGKHQIHYRISIIFMQIEMGYEKEAMEDFVNVINSEGIFLNKYEKAIYYMDLSEISRKLKVFQSSVSYIDSTLGLLRSINDPSQRLSILINIGGAYARLGQFENARNAFSEAGELADKLPRADAAWRMIGEAQDQESLREDAALSFSRASAAAGRLPDMEARAESLAETGDRERRAGFSKQAVQTLLEARRVAEILPAQPFTRPQFLCGTIVPGLWAMRAIPQITPCAQDDVEYEILKEKVQDALLEDNFDAAIKFIGDPFFPSWAAARAYLDMAMAHLRLGHKSAAKAALDKAVAIVVDEDLIDSSLTSQIVTIQCRLGLIADAIRTAIARGGPSLPIIVAEAASYMPPDGNQH